METAFRHHSSHIRRIQPRRYNRYLGQTSKDAITRLKEHLQATKNMEKHGDLEFNKSSKQKNLYTHMLKLGINIWRIFPIVQIISPKADFKTLADTQEYAY